jgi:hypothetical protein
MDVIPTEFSVQDLESEEKKITFLKMIKERVDELMAHDIELLLSYLYRLDVAERDVRQALKNQNETPANESIAKLIYDRQLKRLETRKKFRQKPIEGWEF